MKRTWFSIVLCVLLCSASWAAGPIWDDMDYLLRHTPVQTVTLEQATLEAAGTLPDATYTCAMFHDLLAVTGDHGSTTVYRFPDLVHAVAHSQETLVVSPDGRWVAAPVRGGLALIDPATGKTVRILSLPSHVSWDGIAFNRDGTRLLVGTDSGVLHRYDVPSGRSLGTWSVVGVGAIYHISVLGDNRTLLFSWEHKHEAPVPDGEEGLLDMANGQYLRLTTVRPYEDYVNHRTSTDGTWSVMYNVNARDPSLTRCIVQKLTNMGDWSTGGPGVDAGTDSALCGFVGWDGRLVYGRNADCLEILDGSSGRVIRITGFASRFANQGSGRMAREDPPVPIGFLADGRLLLSESPRFNATDHHTTLWTVRAPF